MTKNILCKHELIHQKIEHLNNINRMTLIILNL